MFGAGNDPSAAGKRSSTGRRVAKLRRLEERIEETNNGYALVRLLDLRLRRERELEAERLRLDRTVAELEYMVAGLERTDADLRDEIDRLRMARHALFLREQALRASIAASEPELVERLRTLHEHDGLEDVLRALDLFEEVPDEPVAG